MNMNFEFVRRLALTAEIKDMVPLSKEAEKIVESKKAALEAVFSGRSDKSLAVKCINGSFVGRKEDGIIAFKGIPFVGAQPVGQYHWKAPVDYVPDAGV